MTIKELKELLNNYDENLPVAYQLHSEYYSMEPEDIELAELVDNKGYLTRPYRPVEHAKKKTWLTFPGN